jgi:diguanylate cyclase (GGDEF)-like protein/PAS domain S-box-containing protein
MNARIQIVEDERIIALDLRHRLEGLGYRITGMAASGEEAIVQVQNDEPELILMDIHVDGELDGIETARRICDDQRIPVVYLTAYAEDETLNRAKTTRPYGYLVKPCETRELHATIQMALQRRQAEIAVERSDDRLRLALDVACLGVWEWNAVPQQFYAGGHLERILGGAPEPVDAGMAGVLAWLHPDDRQAVELSLRHSRMVNGEYRFCRHAGEHRWVEIHARAYPSDNGDTARLLGVIRDVSERRTMQEQLQQAGAVFETAAEAILIVDATQHIQSVNPAFSLLTGYLADEIAGAAVERLVHARQHSSRFYERLATTHDGHWQGEISVLRKDASVFAAFEHVNAVRDATGALTHYVIAFSDISAIRRAEGQLEYLAHHDALTGLPNRTRFNDRLDQELDRARRNNHGCALLFIDLDGFKTINDTMGHMAGDRLLQVLAERIAAALRSTDTAARLGGDEFVVIMPQVHDPGDAGRLAGKLLDVLCLPAEVAGESVEVTASIGISLFPDDGQDRHALLKEADSAMYEAKFSGRNRYAFYTRELAQRAAERMAIEQGLKRALEGAGLEIYYQPVATVGDCALTGVEALVRWRHPVNGPIEPARFIAVAEETCLIDRLGSWVLEHSCTQAAAWLRAGMPPLRLAVNVSARQLANDPFEEFIASVLQKTGLPPHLLEIEITESTLQSADKSLRLVQSLKALGIGVAIDDFGTGYSSLSLLKHLPIDRLKIDKSFIADIPGNANDEAIVEAIMALSRTLDLAVTAEGVETTAQLNLLRRLGCHEFQGYLVSQALPAKDMEQLLVGSELWSSLVSGIQSGKTETQH